MFADGERFCYCFSRYVGGVTWEISVVAKSGDRMDPAAFERKRLALFADNGFAGDSRRVSDRDGRVTYLIDGGDGPRPIILIHGGLAEASIWCLLAGRLRGRLIIPDRPGCGLSYPIDYRGVDFWPAAADWLGDLIDGLDPVEVDLIGSSIGGFFAIAFATKHPDRVRRLVLVGAPAGLDAEVPWFPRLWGNPIVGWIFRKLKITEAKSVDVLRNTIYPLIVAHPEEIPLGQLEIALAAQRLPGAQWAAHTMLRTVRTLRGWRRQLMIRDDLAKLAVPTLFVWGEKDAFAPPSSGQDMVARMTNAEIEIMEDTGHVPSLEQPAAVATIINRFLAS